MTLKLTAYFDKPLKRLLYLIFRINPRLKSWVNIQNLIFLTVSTVFTYQLLNGRLE